MYIVVVLFAHLMLELMNYHCS